MFRKYNPDKYWIKRGKTYKEKFEYTNTHMMQEKVLVDYLKTIDFDTVFEVGCGFGRITGLVFRNFTRNIVAVDMSPDQIEKARAENPEVTFHVAKIQDVMAKPTDLVLACEVLLHIKPEEIKAVMEKLLSMSRKHVITIDPYIPNTSVRWKPHNFNHQYEDIYKQINPDLQVTAVPIGDTGHYLIHARL